MPPAYEVLLLNTAVPQIQAAQSGDTYVVPRDIAFSAALTLSGGTANGVAYLNASKVLTTGSALTFDGTTLVNGVGATWTIGGFRSSGSGVVGIFGANQFASGVVGIGSDSNHPLTFNISSSERMRLTSTGLGIGTSSPGAKLNVVGGNIRLDNNQGVEWGGGNNYIYGNETTDVVAIATNGTERMRLDASGNLGLGVTPSASGSTFGGSQMRTLTVQSANITSAAGYDAFFSQNAYRLADGSWRYQGNGGDNVAHLYGQVVGGAHAWYSAPSGTAGNAISFSQIMTLDASGRLGVGVTNPSVGLVVAYGTDGIIGNYYSSSGVNSRISFSNTGLLNNNVSIGSASDAMVMYTGNAERARITSDGNLSLGGTADRATTVGTKALNIFDGTAPVGTLANGISLYSSSGEAYVMDAAGNATLFSPHDAETNEWIFKSKHTPSGKVLKIDVEKMLRFINDHFGLDAIHEFTEE